MSNNYTKATIYRAEERAQACRAAAQFIKENWGSSQHIQADADRVQPLHEIVANLELLATDIELSLGDGVEEAQAAAVRECAEERRVVALSEATAAGRFEGHLIGQSEDGFFWQEGGFFATVEECQDDIRSWNCRESAREGTL